jgi:peptidoglycan/LPS O-acetylase OafA/YrhL
MLAALVMIGVSVWASLSFIALGNGYKPFIDQIAANMPLNSWQRAIEGAVGATSAYQQLALAVVAAIGGVVWVAAFAVLGAFWTRYSHRINIAAALLLLSGLALALLALAERNGIAAEFLVDVLFRATRWIAAAAMVFTTVSSSGAASRSAC